MPEIALGLDSSTQGLAAVAIDMSRREVLWEHSLDYRGDPRLKRFSLNAEYILPPTEPGEANQPAGLYFVSLEALFEDLISGFRTAGLDPRDIAVINVSGQQHGHVLLNERAADIFDNLNREPTGETSLDEILGPALAVPFARIWRTACTAIEAEHVRRAVGGKARLIELSGSDAPLRFSAFGLRRTALAHPEAYNRTRVIHQISSLLPAVLTGRAISPLDWGNACGASLLDYRARQWSGPLLEAVAGDLPGGAAALEAKLPRLASALSLAGALCRLFVARYGLSPTCRVGVGSGDNPQSKVLVAGTLLSLGSSFVIMAETGGDTTDPRGWANAMYDGLDRPFCFGCRTNGALRWDSLRLEHGCARSDYERAEAALRDTPPGNRGRLFLWQAETESFPVSPHLPPTRLGYDKADFSADYAGLVESSLAAVYLHSRSFTSPGGKVFVTGGPSKSAQVLRRVAALWEREAVAVEAGGAALGAAVSGAAALKKSRGESFDPGEYAAAYLGHRRGVAPTREDVEAYHGENGYVRRFREAERELLGVEEEGL